MLKLIIKDKYLYLLLIWLMITSVAPFTFFLMKWHPYKLLTFFLFSLFVFILFLHRKIKYGEIEILGVWIIQIAYFFVLLAVHADTNYFNLIIQNLVIITAYLIIYNKIGLELFSKSVVWWITIMGVLGSLAFFLALMRFQPFSTFTNPDGRTAFNFGLTFTFYPRFADFYFDNQTLKI